MKYKKGDISWQYWKDLCFELGKSTACELTLRYDLNGELKLYVDGVPLGVATTFVNTQFDRLEKK